MIAQTYQLNARTDQAQICRLERTLGTLRAKLDELAADLHPVPGDPFEHGYQEGQLVIIDILRDMLQDEAHEDTP